MSKQCKSERDHAELRILRTIVGNFLAHSAEGQDISADDLALSLREVGVTLEPEISRRRTELSEAAARSNLDG